MIASNLDETPPPNDSPVHPDSAAGEELSADAARFATQLNSFAGPLDLLLYLIHKNEIDIFDIPIAKILEQYLQHVDALQHSGSLNLNDAGEFLVMAARLMEIKSRMLLPKPEETHEEDLLDAELDDPRVSLVQQLLEYKEIKERAVLLEQVHRRRSLEFERIPPDEIPEPDAVVEVGELTLFDLCEAFQRVLETRKARNDVRVIEFDEVPVEEVIRSLRAFFDREPERSVPFRELFPEDANIGLLIAHFLAILEMARMQLVQITQEENLGEIVLQRRENS